MTDDVDALDARERLFVDARLAGNSKRRSAIIATGCQPNSGDEIAHRMLQKPSVLAAIRAGKAASQRSARLTREQLIARLEDGLSLDPMLAMTGAIAEVPLHVRRWIKKAKTRLNISSGEFTCEYEFPDRLQIARELSAVQGWHAAEKLSVQHTVADERLQMPAGDMSWRDALSDDELAQWGHATVLGDERAAKRLRRLADDRLMAAVSRLKEGDNERSKRH